MAKFQWRAADETLGGVPSLDFSSTGGGAASDWEIVTAAGTPPDSAGGRAVRLKTGASATSWFLIPGAATAGRVDVRMLMYRPVSNVSSLRLAAGFSDDGGVTKCYYADIASSSSWRLSALNPDYAAVVSTGTASTATGWVWIRYTYDPAGATKHRIRFWRATESEAAPFRSATSNTLIAGVNGTEVGLGSQATTTDNFQIAWLTVGTDGDDADAEPNADFPLSVSAITRSLSPGPVALPEPGLTIAGIQYAPSPGSAVLPTIAIWDDFERASINAALSSIGVSDISGDEAGTPLVTLRQRLQTVSSLGNNRWLEPCAKLTGVLGLRPRIEIVPYGTSGDNRNHQTWTGAQRAHYSYDGETWYPIAAKTYSARLTWRHDAAFTADTVYVARSWPRSVTQIGNQVAGLAAAHPTKIAPAPSAVGYTPSNPAGFPAPDYMVQEVSAKTDELGRAVPVTPLYGFVIDDQAYSAKSKTAVITMGIHAGEDLGELVGWEMLDYLLGSSASAVALRQSHRILVYPLANPAGRWAGYWRGAPGSIVDPNREWNVTTPTHDCVTKLKTAILSDVASYGDPVTWGFDVHASPGGGGRLQLGINVGRPETVAFDSLVRTKYPAGLWADYSDRTEPLGDPAASWTITGFQRRDLAAKLVMLNETCDAVGPVSPTVMRPYAEAQVDALADMDAAGWFNIAPAGTLTLGTPSVTSSSISLPWSYSAEDHDGVEYRYRLTAGTWSAWVDAGLVTPIEIAGLVSGVEYEIEARAYNSAGVGTPQPVTIAIGEEAPPLAATAVSASTASGSLSTSIRMAGASASLSLADGDLSTAIRLQGHGLSASSGMAVLSGASAGLVGVGVTGSLAVGSLDTEIRLSGVGASRSEVWADLKSASVGLLGAAQSISAGLGELRTGIRLAVTARSQSAARAALVGGEPELPPPWRVLRLRYPSRILRLRP